MDDKRKVDNWSNQNAEMPGVSMQDFEQMKFGDLDSDEVYWLNDNRVGEQNQIWKKLDDFSAINLRTGEQKAWNSNDTVFMRI